jgi:hypothetical protein
VWAWRNGDERGRGGTGTSVGLVGANECGCQRARKGIGGRVRVLVGM